MSCNLDLKICDRKKIFHFKVREKSFRYSLKTLFKAQKISKTLKNLRTRTKTLEGRKKNYCKN